MSTPRRPRSDSWIAALLGVLATLGLIVGWGVLALSE